MAKITAGILGGFSGKIGNIVGASWKGINTMRTLPASVANPRTTGQVAQRNAFTGVVELAKKSLVSTIKPLNDRFAVKQSGYNLFISRNIANFDSQGEIIDQAKVVYSEGQLGDTEIESIIRMDNQNVQILFSSSVQGKQLATDLVYLVFVDTMTGKVVRNRPQAGVRGDGAVSVELDINLSTSDSVYLMFRSADGTKVSNTTYGVLS